MPDNHEAAASMFSGGFFIGVFELLCCARRGFIDSSVLLREAISILNMVNSNSVESLEQVA